MESLQDVATTISRRKQIRSNILDTNLNRCLTTFDLTFIGLSYVIAGGVFVITGSVAAKVAGPAVDISIILATISALLSAVCYAEFCCRVPQAGSAYLYIYLTIGEIWAFVVGWNMVLEFMAAATSIARSLAAFIDRIFDDAIKNATVNYIMRGKEWNSPFLSSYPDFLAAFLILIFTIVLLFGVNASSRINNMIFSVTTITILILVVCGGVFIDFHNWTDYGGFFPYGFSGVLTGSAKIFYIFAGFEVICVSSEECKTPIKSVPRALVYTVLISALINILVASTVTLMVPWCDINPAVPFPDAFERLGQIVPTYIVLVGMILAISSAVLLALHTQARLVYAMAKDGLLFSQFARVSSGNQVPVIATLTFGVISIIVVLFINFDALVESLNIGSLVCYTIVSGSVINLRYRTEHENARIFNKQECTSRLLTADHTDNSGKLKSDFESWTFLKSDVPGRVVGIAIVMYTVFCTCAVAQLSHSNMKGGYLLLFFVFILGSIFSFVVILMHQQNNETLSFKVYYVPYVPALAILSNVTFLVNLSSFTWIRFVVWVFVGLLIYGAYGYHHSLMATSDDSSSDEVNQTYSSLSDEEPTKYGTVELRTVQPDANSELN